MESTLLISFLRLQKSNNGWLIHIICSLFSKSNLFTTKFICPMMQMESAQHMQMNLMMMICRLFSLQPRFQWLPICFYLLLREKSAYMPCLNMAVSYLLFWNPTEEIPKFTSIPKMIRQWPQYLGLFNISSPKPVNAISLLLYSMPSLLTAQQPILSHSTLIGLPNCLKLAWTLLMSEFNLIGWSATLFAGITI